MHRIATHKLENKEWKKKWGKLYARGQHYYKPNEWTDTAWKGTLATTWSQEKSFNSMFSTGNSHCEAPSGDSSTSSNSTNGRECAIPEHPLAWSSVLATGLQQVGKDNNPNGKSLRIWKMLTTHRSKTTESFLSHTSAYSSDTPTSSFHHLPWQYCSLHSHCSVARYYWSYSGSISVSEISGK